MNIVKQSIEFYANETIKQVDNGLFLFAISHTIQTFWYFQPEFFFPGKFDEIEKAILNFIPCAEIESC